MDEIVDSSAPVAWEDIAGQEVIVIVIVVIVIVMMVLLLNVAKIN